MIKLANTQISEHVNNEATPMGWRIVGRGGEKEGVISEKVVGNK